MPNTNTYSKLFNPTAIATSATTILTVAGQSSAAVLKNASCVICNTTSSGITVEVWIVPSGGSAGDSNKLINSEIVSGNDRLSFVVPDMAAGDVIVATGSGAGLTIHSTSGVIIN